MSKFFKCECGSNFICDDTENICEKTAEEIGWRKINGKWVCPVCCGNTAALETLLQEEGCECDVCQKGLEAVRRKEEECLTEYGWYAHFVGNDSNCPYSLNAHTHGLEENFNHIDLQACVPLETNLIHSVFCELIEKIKEGRSFKTGEVVTNIFENDIPITFAKARENDRDVLRVIFPDPELHIKREEMIEDYGHQWEGTIYEL